MKIRKFLFNFILITCLFVFSVPYPCLAVNNSSENKTSAKLKNYKTNKYILNNGMTVIIRQVPSVNMVAINALVKTGSASEGRLTGSGVTHFLEHMLFKGTAERGVGKIQQEVRSYGGDINAFTSYDYTSYYLTIMPEYINNGLSIIQDVLCNAVFDEQEFAKEKDVVLNEIRMNNDDPVKRISELMWSTSYIEHPYRYPVIGYEDIFRKLSRDDVISYYKSKYVPNNIILTIVGNVKTEEVLAEVKDVFKEFKRKNLFIPPIAEEPIQMSLRKQYNRVDVNISYMNMSFHTVSLRDKDLYALDVLSIILGGGDSSRLNKVLRNEKKLVYSVDSWSYTPKYKGLFGISSSLEGSKLNSVINEILNQINRIKEKPVSKKELEKAKKQVLSAYIFSYESIEYQAQNIASDQALTGDYNFSQQYVYGINNVTAEDLKRVANKYLNKNNLTITALMPKRKKEKSKLDNIKTECDLSKEVFKYVLPNGMTVLLNENKDVPVVSIRVVFKGGVRVENKENNGICSLVSKMLLKGTTSMTAEEIDEAVESRGMSISSFSGNNSFGLSMSMLKEDLDFGLNLLNDIITKSVFPADKLKHQKELVIAALKAQEDDIYTIASKLLRKTIFKTHPYGFDKLGEEKIINRLTREQLIDFYNKYVVWNNMVMSICGDIDKYYVSDYIKREFVDKDKKWLIMPKINQETKQEKIRTKVKYVDKNQTILMLGFKGIDVHSEDRYIFTVLNALISGGGARLFDSIREKEGLAYTLGAYLVMGLDPGYYAFYAATEASKVKEVKQKLLEEIEKLKKSYVTDEELERTKRFLIGERELSFQTNSSFAFQIALDELYNLGYDSYKQYKEKISLVTKDDIKRVCNKYLDTTKYSMVIVGPREQLRNKN